MDILNLKGGVGPISLQRVVAAVPDFSWGCGPRRGRGYWKVSLKCREPLWRGPGRARRQAADRAVALSWPQRGLCTSIHAYVDRERPIGPESRIFVEVAGPRGSTWLNWVRTSSIRRGGSKRRSTLNASIQLRRMTHFPRCTCTHALGLANALVRRVEVEQTELSPHFDAASDLAQLKVGAYCGKAMTPAT